METANFLLLCALDRRLCAFRFGLVKRVLRAVAITPLPQAPVHLLGAVNVAGHFVPVVDLRYCLGLPTRELEPSDRFVMTQTARRPLIFVVDAILEISDVDLGKRVPLKHVLPGAKKSVGVECFADGPILINTVDAFLMAEEERRLTAMLAEVR